MLNSGQKSTIFLAVWPWNLKVDPEKQQGTSSMLPQALCIISYPLMNSNWSYRPERPNLGQIWRFLEPCDPEIWWMTLKNNPAPLLCYFKLFASFCSHLWIQTGVTVRKRKFGSNSMIFLALWPWNLTGDLEKQYGTSSILFQALCIISYPLVNSNWSYSPERTNLGQNRHFFEPCVLQTWQVTLKKHRAPLLCYFKLCASFRFNWWIETGVTVRKRPIWVKIDNFFSRVTFKLDRWLWKTIVHLFCATSSFVHHFVTIGELKLELQSGNAQFGSKSTIF